jgi:hypothetical protein
MFQRGPVLCELINTDGDEIPARCLSKKDVHLLRRPEEHHLLLPRGVVPTSQLGERLVSDHDDETIVVARMRTGKWMCFEYESSSSDEAKGNGEEAVKNMIDMITAGETEWNRP